MGMDEILDGSLFAGIAHKTGLTESTCEELLRAGWQYFESVDHPPVWKSPGYALQSTFQTLVFDKPLLEIRMPDWRKESLEETHFGQEVQGVQRSRPDDR